MIAIDYRNTRGMGFNFHVAVTEGIEKLTTILKTIVTFDALDDSGTAATGWIWDGRTSTWIVRRYYWATFLEALRSVYPGEDFVFTQAAEAAAVEEFTDAATKVDIGDEITPWMVFGIRTDAPWAIATVAIRAVAWGHSEMIRTGNSVYRVSPFGLKAVLLAFIKLHRTYGEPDVPGDIVDYLRRIAATDENAGPRKRRNFSPVSSAILRAFQQWETRYSTKIQRQKGAKA